jgi:hypothetical protein
METEDALRLNARRLGTIALLVFSGGYLVILLNLTISIIILSNIRIPPNTPPHYITGFMFILIGLLLYIIFPLYASFGGSIVVSRINLKGWGGLVSSLGIIYFSATLFTTIGIFIFLGDFTKILDMLRLTPLYSITMMFIMLIIIFFIFSLLLMISALLAPSPKYSIQAGILLIIASILLLIGGSMIPGLSLISFFLNIPVHPVVPLIFIGIALILRQVVLNWPISHIIAAIGGIFFATNIAYISFSTISYFSLLFSFIQPLLSMLPQGYTASSNTYMIFFFLFIVGFLLIGIAAILGITALILSIVHVAKAISSRLNKAETSSMSIPIKEMLYCPKCGSLVEPEYFYCSNCGNKLK